MAGSVRHLRVIKWGGPGSREAMAAAVRSSLHDAAAENDVPSPGACWYDRVGVEGG